MFALFSEANKEHMLLLLSSSVLQLTECSYPMFLSNMSKNKKSSPVQSSMPYNGHHQSIANWKVLKLGFKATHNK